MTAIYRYEQRRQPGGAVVAVPVAVTTPVQVVASSTHRDRTIRALYRRGRTQAEIARQYRLTQQQVSRILKGTRSGSAA